MKSKVVKVAFRKEFTTANGSMFSWHVTMDNGDAGETATKANKEPWAVGEEAEYTKEEKEYNGQVFTKIKKVYANGQGGFHGAKKWTPDPEKETRVERWAKQLLISRQACLNTAASLIASGAGPATIDNITALADKLAEHVYQGVDIRKLAKGPDKPAITSDPVAKYTSKDMNSPDSIRAGHSTDLGGNSSAMPPAPPLEDDMPF